MLYSCGSILVDAKTLEEFLADKSASLTNHFASHVGVQVRVTLAHDVNNTVRIEVICDLDKKNEAF